MLRACARANVPHVTIRDLRRTFATRGLENDNDAATIADALGTQVCGWFCGTPGVWIRSGNWWNLWRIPPKPHSVPN
jgi:hypothetical protein